MAAPFNVCVVRPNKGEISLLERCVNLWKISVPIELRNPSRGGGGATTVILSGGKLAAPATFSDELGSRVLLANFCPSALGNDAFEMAAVDRIIERLSAGGFPVSEKTMKEMNESLKFSSYLAGNAMTLADASVFHAIVLGHQSDATKQLLHLARWFGLMGGDEVKGNCILEAKAETKPSTENRLSISNTAAAAANQSPQNEKSPSNNFIYQIIDNDLRTGKHDYIITRFPPEPNGFLHLGHAKSICLNFGIAKKYGGRCNLRFDDTNPAKEDHIYIDSIIEDVRWLGGEFDEALYASDYFPQFYEWALDLIRKGHAYVDDQSEAEVKANRGDVRTPGVESPYRNRSVEENLRLFKEMEEGKIPEGKRVLRAKIDMASGNMNMRDPLVYRVKREPHPRTGDKWNIYPMYDFAHGQEDSIEKITHSICTLEFEDHRPLYDWYQEKLDIFRTRQIEFARLNVTNTITSKRHLLTLVNEKVVEDWDDPRMPTLCGMRRRGYPARALQDFCERVGLAKRDNLIQMELLEACVRESLSDSPRRLAVLRPLKLTITNYPEGTTEEFDVPNNPESEAMGKRKVVFGRDLWIEQDDFMENPTHLFFRLAPGREVRLRYAYWVKCEEVVHCPESGAVTEIRCTYDPNTKFGNPPPDGRKVKGTIHWVHRGSAICIEARLYENLLLDDQKGSAVDSGCPSPLPASPDTPPSVSSGPVSWRDNINRNSLECLRCYAEPSCKDVPLGGTVQFERLGFFTRDVRSPVMTQYRGHLVPEQPRFNRTIGLVDNWAAKSDESSKAAQLKEATKLARAKAAEERQRKKEDRAKRLAEKAAT